MRQPSRIKRKLNRNARLADSRWWIRLARSMAIQGGFSVNIAELQAKTNSELQALAREFDVSAPSKLRKQELIMQLLRADTEKEGLIFAQGILEILPDGYGFLRVNNYAPGSDDVYVSPSQIRRFSL